MINPIQGPLSSNQMPVLALHGKLSDMLELHMRYKNWRYKNTALLIFSVVLLVVLMDSQLARTVLHTIGKLGYVGAFFSGILFVSTFTVAPSAVILFFLAEELNPWGVAFVAGIGAVIGDYIIFRFLKDRVFEEVKPLFMHFGGSYFSRLFATPYFGWLAPVVGAILIASPLPDEAGVGLLGSTKIKRWQFLLLTFTLNFFGIITIITSARIF